MRMRTVKNSVIVTGGGTLRARQLAVGKKARAIATDLASQLSDMKESEQLQLSIRELGERLAASERSVAVHQETLKALEALVAGMRVAKPNRGRLKELLENLTTSAGSVASVAKAVESVRTAINGML